MFQQNKIKATNKAKQIQPQKKNGNQQRAKTNEIQTETKPKSKPKPKSNHPQQLQKYSIFKRTVSKPKYLKEQESDGKGRRGNRIGKRREETLK